MHTFQDILVAVKSSPRVVIVGYPASGKTTLAKRLEAENTGHEVIHTDDEYPSGDGSSETAYTDLLVSDDLGWSTIVEGVLGYRLLRKCVEHGGEWLPDLIIEVRCSEEARVARYREERPKKDYRRVKSFCKGLDTVMKVWAESEISKEVKHMVFETGFYHWSGEGFGTRRKPHGV